MAAPVFAGHLLSFPFGAVDMVFVSLLNRESTALVTGVGLTMPLNLLALAAGTGLLSGTASLVGRALGAKDDRKVAQAGRAALSLGVLSALALGAGFLIGAGPLFGFFAGPTVSPEAREAARAYLLAVTPGYAVLPFELSVMGLLMGREKPRRTAPPWPWERWPISSWIPCSCSYSAGA